MRKKLTNAPVYYTLAQVQFNPVLDLDNFVPAIQSKMREAHFPDFKKEVFQRLDFPVLGTEQGQMVPPTMTTQSRYMFGDLKGQTAFLLEANVLTLQTTAYDTFGTFSGALMAALNVLHSKLRLDFVDRIGLRYLNAIQPLNDGEQISDFLVKEVLGLSQRSHGQLQQSISETAVLTNAGQLISRVIVRDGQIGLPLELSGSGLNIAPQFTQQQGIHAIVDTDASFAQREAFESSQIKDRLMALHDEIEASFEATVTKHAWAAWA